MDLSQRQVCSWEFGNSPAPKGLCYSTKAFFTRLQLSDLFFHSRSLIQVQDIDRKSEVAPFCHFGVWTGWGTELLI